MKYPNPCENCSKRNLKCRGCDKWLIRFRTIWKQFNGYPGRVYKKIASTKRQNFIYSHPDEIRRYLETGPCEKCKNTAECDNPCVDYWIWWDARMEWLKRRWGIC